jgi:thiamine-monophosphate kinase
VSSSEGEIAAIERIRLVLPQPPRGEIWIGDDTAVVAGPAGSLLLAADAVVEGVHFDLDLVDTADVGWKALAVNVSDVAAMGGEPLHALVTVVGAAASMIDGLARGLAEASAAYRCPVVGGDLSAGPCLVVSVAITGACDLGGAVLRSNARPGDSLFVTGPLGRSAAGLRGLRSESEGAHATQPDLVAAYRRPSASAMIDVSDGLGIDLDRLAGASGVGVVLELVPVADGATREDALGGGEDYELVFAASDPQAVVAAFSAAGLRPPIRIGLCVEDPATRRVGDETLEASGWEHRLR